MMRSWANLKMESSSVFLNWKCTTEVLYLAPESDVSAKNVPQIVARLRNAGLVLVIKMRSNPNLNYSVT